MNKHMNSMTALKPSFGMPVHGGTALATLGCSGPVIAKRVRPVAVIAMDAVVVATTQRAFAGTPAWRPPSC
jgi:hypothetical protein